MRKCVHASSAENPKYPTSRASWVVPAPPHTGCDRLGQTRQPRTTVRRTRVDEKPWHCEREKKKKEHTHLHVEGRQAMWQRLCRAMAPL